MQKYEHGRIGMRPDEGGDWCFYGDAIAYAEEQAKKARREALEEALDILADYNVEPMCAKQIRELMEKD